MVVKVVGLGAGGHARVVIEILRPRKSYELIGLLDPKPELQGKSVLGVPVLGDDDLLPILKHDGICHFFVGLGSIGDTRPRQRLFELALQYEMKPVDAVHPQAIVSPSAELGKGVTIMAGAAINACARLGVNVIVNTGAIVEHDCVIGDHVHIATGAQLASTVQVRNGAHIGAGATVLQCVRIGENAVVGAGTVVIQDVPPGVIVVGCPARVLQRKEQEGEEN
jgi:sugar O-acyltransferase (sialic acid O-acetyltransferase NeuD family)